MRHATARLLPIVAVALGATAPLLGGEGDKEVDAKARKVLERVGRFFENVEAFRVKASLEVHQETGKRSRDASAEVDIAAARPNRLAIRPGESKVPLGTLVSDGKKLYAHQPSRGRYTVKDAGESFDALMSTRLVRRLGRFVATPVKLLQSNPVASLLADAERVTYVGKEMIEKKAHHRIRLAGRRPPVDLWFQAGERPLLRRLVPDFSKQLENQGRGDTKVEVVLRFDGWELDPDLPKAAFQFTPPDGATKVADLFKSPEQDAQGAKDSPKELVGKAAPPFTLERLQGGKVKLASHEGKHVVILDFWATWCGPCRRAMPVVEKVAEKFADRGVVLYAVNLQEGPEKIRAFLKEEDLDVDVLLDRKGKVASKYRVKGIPQTVIIGRDGTVKHVEVGFTPGFEKTLTEELAPLATKKGADKDQ